MFNTFLESLKEKLRERMRVTFWIRLKKGNKSIVGC